MKTSFWIGLLAIAISIQQSSFAQAGLLSALVNGAGGQSLLTFNSATPGIGTPVSISGLLGGESLLGLDYRPQTTELYGLSSGSSIYTIDVASGAATLVGTGFGGTLLSGSTFGFDFNPTIDRIRVVSNSDQNLVINPITGASQLNATPVFYVAGDVNFEQIPNVIHHAYDNNTFGLPRPLTSQLFAIDSNLNVLVTQANNLGELRTVGPLGIDVPNSGLGGFDVSADGTAFATFNDGIASTSSLYTINLATGAATNIGTIPFAVNGLAAAVPEPGSLSLLGLAIAGFVVRRRKLRMRKLLL